MIVFNENTTIITKTKTKLKIKIKFTNLDITKVFIDIEIIRYKELRELFTR